MLTDINRIGILRALNLGDLLCAVPAFRALKAAYPGAEISLIGLPWSRAFQSRYRQYIDEMIEFPGYPGLPERDCDIDSIPVFINDMRSRRFDLLLQMQGKGTIVNPLVHAMKARYTAGFRPDKTEGLFLEYPDRLHEIHRHLSLLKHLDIPVQSSALEFPLNAADYAAFGEINDGLTEHQYICVHPGSKGAWRQWPTPYFAAIADYLAEKGYKIVITGVPSETGIAEEVLRYMRYPAVNLAGKTTLGSMAVLLQKARGLVSNCTGVSHLAAAIHTPSLVISMDGEAFRWSPLNTQLHQVVDWTKHQEYDYVIKQCESLLERTEYVLL